MNSRAVPSRGRARLLDLKPLRYQLVDIPLKLNHPMCSENADIDIDYHLRRVSVPAPGGRGVRGMNVTVWSDVDQLNSSALTDDLTTDDPREVTGAMIRSFADIGVAAGLSAELNRIAAVLPMAGAID